MKRAMRVMRVMRVGKLWPNPLTLLVLLHLKWMASNLFGHPKKKINSWTRKKPWTLTWHGLLGVRCYQLNLNLLLSLHLPVKVLNLGIVILTNKHHMANPMKWQLKNNWRNLSFSFESFGILWCFYFSALTCVLKCTSDATHYQHYVCHYPRAGMAERKLVIAGQRAAEAWGPLLRKLCRIYIAFALA